MCMYCLCCLCVYVCMCVRVYVCARVSVCVCVVCLYVCVFVCACMYVSEDSMGRLHGKTMVGRLIVSITQRLIVFLYSC